MKKLLFASAMAAAATLTATSALAQVTGYAGFSGSTSEVQVSGVEANADAVGVHGAVFAPINETLGVQFDASYTDAEDADGVLAGTAHLIGNLGDQMRVGAFVGAAEFADETAVAGGVEGQVNYDRVTLAANAAYGTVDEFDLDIWGVSGEARFFASDNFRIDGGLGWASADADGFEAEGWTAGLGGEARFYGPASVFLAYNYAELDELDVAANTITLGMRFSFDGSLKERDRAGASFGGIQNLLTIASF